MKINKEQIIAVLLGLFATSGPLASWLLTYAKMESQTVAAIMSLAQIFTPFIAGGIYYWMQRDAAKVAAVQSLPVEKKMEVAAALPVEVKAADAAALPPSEAVKMAVALPSEANLAAVNAMPDVAQVIVHDNASNGVSIAMKDPTLEKVVPQSAT